MRHGFELLATVVALFENKNDRVIFCVCELTEANQVDLTHLSGCDFLNPYPLIVHSN